MDRAWSILLLVAATASAAQIVEREFPGKRKGLVMDSELLRVGVIPAIGGRVVELVPKTVGKNYLRTAPHYFGFGPNDPWPGAEYGGINDVASEGWPGPFWGVEYKAETLGYQGVLGLRLSAEAEAIGIRRDLLIPHNSTRLIVIVRQTNLTDQPKKMVVRLHNELRVGTRADAHDVIFWRDGKALKTRRYIPGSESPRFCFDHVTEDWAAIVDTVEREALIHRFIKPKGPHRVFFWSGHNAPPPGVQENAGDHGFYNNERFGPRIEVPPGKPIELVEEFWAIRGLGRVDFCIERAAGSLELPRERFGRDDPIAVTCAFGSPHDAWPLAVEVALRSPDGKTLATLEARLTGLRPGEAASATLTFAPRVLANGRYAVVATFRRREQVLARAERTFEVAGQLVADARKAIAQLQQRADQLRARWLKEPGEPSRVDAIRVKVLQARVDALQPLLDQGAFEELLTRAPRVKAAIDRTVRDRERALAPKKQAAEDAQAVLERYHQRD